MKFTPEEYNHYASWVLNAVLGLLGPADGLMSESGGTIRRMAKKLRKELGLPARPIYRGLLLDEHEVVDGKVLPHPTHQFVSFSEDRDVACWFAARDSSISAFALLLRPSMSGWIMEAWPKKEEVLFHWSWAPRFPAPKGGGTTPLWHLAQMNPEWDEAKQRQLEWSMKTQREVIVRPAKQALKVIRYADAGCPPTAGLEERLGFRLNPGDEDLRRRERRMVSGASPEDRAQFARARQRRGEQVDPWELVPLSYVFLDAYEELVPHFVLTTPTSGSLGLKGGRVEAYRMPAFKPWLTGAAAEKPERFYVTASSYPLSSYGMPPAIHASQEERAGSHLEAIEDWRRQGAIVVRFEFDADERHTQHLHATGLPTSWIGTGPDPGVCRFCRVDEAASLHVLVKETNVRNALTSPMVWEVGYQQSVLFPEQWDWARLMKRRGKAWKNPRLGRRP